MASSVSGQDNQILLCDWLPDRARWKYLSRSGLPTASCKKEFPESHITNPLLFVICCYPLYPLACSVKMTFEFMHLDCVSVHKNTKIAKAWTISSHLDLALGQKPKYMTTFIESTQLTTCLLFIAPGNISPGEIVGEPSGVMREPHPASADFTLDDVAENKEQIPTEAAHEVARSTADGGPSHDDWSLHVSDLIPGTLGTDIASPAFTQRQRSKPRVIQVEERESEASGSHSQKTYSLNERRTEITVPPNKKQDPADVSEPEAREMEPQQPTKIQVTLPSIDDVHEESSLASEHPVSIEQDTFGDVSSISGGDF